VLWYKAWLETRARFLTSVATLTIFCGLFIHHALYIACSNSFPCGQGLTHPPKQEDLHFLLAVTQNYVVIIWVLAVVLLGMGGIVREKALGTSSLTLSLPVSRARLLAVRIALGVAQSIVLAVVPWVMIFLVSRQAGVPVSITQAGIYVLLLVGGGLVYFAMAILISSLVAGEYTAPALAFGIVLLPAIVFDMWLRRFNVWRLITGDFSIDRRTYLLSTHLPWAGILASLSAAVLMLFASTIVLQKREF
jgi:ABC-2 type transport system permease protein